MTSNTLPTDSASTGDIIKYAVAVVLVLAGVFAYYWFENAMPAGLRAVLVAVGLGLAAFVFLGTKKGVQTREFLSESRFELRKVVWPTRSEATRTMWVVIAAVILISLILAAFDWVIQLAVKALLGN